MKKCKILFIKPGDRIKNYLWAIHHFALESSRLDRFKVYFATSNFRFHKSKNIINLSIYPPLEKSTALFKIYFKRILDLAGVLIRIRPDIIYINNHIGAFSCLLMARILRIKTKIILDIRTLPDKKWKYYYYRCITPFFDWVFALNNEIISRMVNNKNWSLLPLGFEPTVFFPGDVRKAYCYARTSIRCIYYGSLDRKRKLKQMISGFRKAVNSGCDIYLTVIGAGNGKQELLQFVNETRLDYFVTFHDVMDQHKLREIVCDHDLGISFVPNEGMYIPQVPLKAVEMLACGLPVLATDPSGNRMIVKHLKNGYIANDNTEGICDVLQNIWENGISEKMHINAVKSIDDLSWEKIVEAHLFPVFNKILPE